MKPGSDTNTRTALMSWQEKRMLALMDGAEINEKDHQQFSKTFLLNVAHRKKKDSDKETRMSKALQALVDLCNLDFDLDLSFSEYDDEIDAFCLGLNTVAEELKFHTETLEQNNKSLAMVQRLGRVGSWIYHEENGKAKLSDTLLEIYNHPKKVFENFEAFLDITHPDDRGLLIATIKNAKASKKPFEITHRVFTGSGQLKYLESHGEVVVDKTGKITAIQGSTLDITNLVNKQEELIKLSDQLVKSKRSLENAQRIGRVGSWSWIVDEEFTTWSKSMYETFALNKDQPTDHDTYLNYVHPDDLQSVKIALNSCNERGVPFIIIHKIIDQKGKVKWLESRGEPILDKDGMVSTVAGTVHDVTTMVQQKQQLEELNSDLESMVKDRTRELEAFTYSISHDLRAPLRAIVGYAEMLNENSADLGANQKRLVETILKNSKKLTELINSLLGLYSIRRSKPNFELVNLEHLFKQVWSNLQEHHNQSTRFTFHCDHLPTFKGNKALLEQAAFNLLENAVKYAGKAEYPEIRISYRIGIEYNEIVISDNGPGFDNANADRLFEVFCRLHDANTPGLGVGLATVKEIIQLHNGKISAYSNPHLCTSFIVQLPKNQFYPDYKPVSTNNG